MTQTNAPNSPERRPNRPPRPTTFRPTPGTRVRYEGENAIGLGTVVESDDWWDTFQLRGVSSTAQVLVEWEREGKPVRQWTLISNLRKAEVAK